MHSYHNTEGGSSSAWMPLVTRTHHIHTVVMRSCFVTTEKAEP